MKVRVASSHLGFLLVPAQMNLSSALAEVENERDIEIGRKTQEASRACEDVKGENSNCDTVRWQLEARDPHGGRKVTLNAEICDKASFSYMYSWPGTYICRSLLLLQIEVIPRAK